MTRPDLFNHTLNNLRYGQAQLELSETLTNAVNMARLTGKVAEVTLTLKIKTNATGKQVFITDAVKSKIPEFDREQTILFPTEDGNLQRDDPQQAQLPGIRSVTEERLTNFKQA